MSQTEQFWQYAKEAIISAVTAKTEEDRRDLFDLARTWTQAALVERTSAVATTTVCPRVVTVA
jgi:hypothetical protein